MQGPDKILIKLKLDDIPLNMELDTGAAMSVMTKTDYKNIFKKEPVLQSTSVTLKTYTNQLIKPLGKITVRVKYKKIDKKLPLIILQN